jgi:hypothetical protein
MSSILTGSFMEVQSHSAEAEKSLVDDSPKQNIGLQEYLQAGNTLTTDGASGVTSVSRVQTVGAAQAFSPMADDSILGTAHRKNSSVIENNHKAIMADPESYLIQIDGVELTVQSALRMGLLAVAGTGEIVERSVRSVVAPPAPKTTEEVLDNQPISPFSADGANLYGLMAERLGSENRAYQVTAQLLTVFTDPQYEDAASAFEAAGRKLSTVLPSLGKAGSEKVARALFKGLSDGIGREIAKIDRNIDPDHFMEWLGDVRDDHQRSMLLGVLAGSRPAVKQLVDKYKLKNRS